jgi:hypothetical protein
MAESSMSSCLQAATPAFHRFDVAAGAKSERDIDSPEFVDSEPTEKAAQQSSQQSPQLTPFARQRAVPRGLPGRYRTFQVTGQQTKVPAIP